MSTAVERIPPQTAHEHLQVNCEAMLVCAYDDNAQFDKNCLEGAMALNEFES